MAHFMKPAISDKRGYDPRTNKQTISTGKSSDVTLWGGGSSGELLIVAANDPSVVDVLETESFKADLRNFRVNSHKAGSAMLEARDDKGNVWAFMQIEVEGPAVASVINATPSNGVVQTTAVETQPAIDRLAAVSRKLRLAVKEIRQHPFDEEYVIAANFLGRISALANMVGILAEQPGYRPGDAQGNAVKARMAPLKAKMVEITKHVDATVNLSAPLSATAPDRVSARADDALRLVGILLDPKNADDIHTVSMDGRLTYVWKDLFFNELAMSIHQAMMEVLKTKHEDKIFDAVGKTLNGRTKDTLMGAIVWAVQSLASVGGNLPGPNSIYVSYVRIDTLRNMKKLLNNPVEHVLEGALPHWFDALKFDSSEQAAFSASLKKFTNEHKNIDAARRGPVPEYRETYAKVAAQKAQVIYDEELVPLVRLKGSPQSGFGLSASVTGLNMICLLAVWWSTPSLEQFASKDYLNVGLAAVNAGFGICATLARSRCATEWAIGLANSKVAGVAIGYFTAVISVWEGGCVILGEIQKRHPDGWIVFSGVLQVGSGVAIAIGVFCGTPGGQLLGVALGIAAGVIAIVDELAKDKMVCYLSELISLIKEAKSTWDNKKLVDNVGLTVLVNELEELVISCGVTELSYDRTWTGPGGSIVSKDIVHDKLNVLGIHDAGQRDRLTRAVWTS